MASPASFGKCILPSSRAGLLELLSPGRAARQLSALLLRAGREWRRLRQHQVLLDQGRQLPRGSGCSRTGRPRPVSGRHESTNLGFESNPRGWSASSAASSFMRLRPMPLLVEADTHRERRSA